MRLLATGAITLAVTPYLYMPTAARAGQRHDAALGRRVVGLGDRAGERTGRERDHRARLLLAEDGGRGTEHGERALQVGLDDRVPLLLAHVEEHPLAQDAGDADDTVDPPEAVDRGLHDAGAALHRGDRVGHGDGVAAGGLDLLDHLVRDRAVGVLAVHRHAVVGDDDVRAQPGALDRDGAADAPPGAGDGDAQSIEVTHGAVSPCESVGSRLENVVLATRAAER